MLRYEWEEETFFKSIYLIALVTLILANINNIIEHIYNFHLY
jgi:hypothetical protein